jgi:hypothetical protein
MATIDEVLSTTINSEADAKAYLKSLVDNGYCYHPDDDASDIGIFSEDQAEVANVLMCHVFQYLPDPCAYILEIDPNE